MRLCVANLPLAYTILYFENLHQKQSGLGRPDFGKLGLYSVREPDTTQLSEIRTSLDFRHFLFQISDILYYNITHYIKCPKYVLFWFSDTQVLFKCQTIQFLDIWHKPRLFHMKQTGLGHYFCLKSEFLFAQICFSNSYCKLYIFETVES